MLRQLLDDLEPWAFINTPHLEKPRLAKRRRGKCVISQTFTPSQITTVSFSSLRNVNLSLTLRWALPVLMMLAH